MPQYYFSVRNSRSSERQERGRDFPDLHAALAEAQGMARSLIRNHVRRAAPDLHGSLDVEDEGRRPVARIMFADLARQLS